MAKSLHNDVFDSGLEQLKNSSGLTLVLTVGVPADRTAAATLYPTGTRASNAVSLSPTDCIIGDRTGGGREIVFAAKSGTSAIDLSAGSDLHAAIYDDTRLLLVTDEQSDQALTNGNTIDFPSFKTGATDPT